MFRFCCPDFICSDLDFYQNPLDPIFLHSSQIHLCPSLSSLPRERKVLGSSSRTACPPQAAAAQLKRPRWRSPPCERFYRFLLQRSRGTRDPTAVNFSRARADRAASRSGNHYVSHGFTTCGPSCLLPLILWSGCSHTLPGTQGGAFLRGDVSRLLCLREENQQYLGGLVEGGDARQK